MHRSCYSWVVGFLAFLSDANTVCLIFIITQLRGRTIRSVLFDNIPTKYRQGSIYKPQEAYPTQIMLVLCFPILLCFSRAFNRFIVIRSFCLLKYSFLSTFIFVISQFMAQRTRKVKISFIIRKPFLCGMWIIIMR